MNLGEAYGSFPLVHLDKNHFAKWSTLTFCRAHQSRWFLPFSFWWPSTHLHLIFMSPGIDSMSLYLMSWSISADGWDTCGGCRKSFNWSLAVLLSSAISISPELILCWSTSAFMMATHGSSKMRTHTKGVSQTRTKTSLSWQCLRNRSNQNVANRPKT